MWNRALASVSLLLAAASLTACGDESPIRLAAVLPLTGASAVYGQSVERGAAVAMEELAQQSRTGMYPYDLELEVVDSEGDPERAAKLLAELYGDGVVAAVGGVTSAEALAMAEVADEVHKVLLSPTAGSPRLAGLSRYFFRLFPSGEREGNKLGSFAALELGVRRGVVVAPAGDGATAESFRRELERNQGRVVGRVDYRQPAEEASELAAEVVSHRPQAVLVDGHGTAVAEIVAGLDAGGYRGAVLTTSAFAAPAVLEAAGRHAEGVLLSRPHFDPGADDPVVRRFAEAYREKHGEDPDLYAAYGYDAVKVLATALVEEGTFARSLWKGMQAIRGLRGATGHIQFDPAGEVTVFPRVYVISGGEPKELAGMDERRRRRMLQQIALRMPAASEGRSG